MPDKPILRRAGRNRLQQSTPQDWSGLWPDRMSTSRQILRSLRAVRRGVLAVLWTVIAAGIQAVLLMLPGRAKVVFARFYWPSSRP